MRGRRKGGLRGRGEEKDRRLGGEEKDRRLGGEEKDRRLGGEEKDRRLGREGRLVISLASYLYKAYVICL